MGTPAELDHNGAKIAYPGYLMQQSFETYYTISARSLLEPAASTLLEQDCCLNIVLDTEQAELARLLMLLNNRGKRFLVSLPGHIARDTITLKALLPACYLLVSSDLFAAADAAFIPVLCEEKTDQLELSTVSDYFQTQGIDKMRTPVFACIPAGIQRDPSCTFIFLPSVSTVRQPDTADILPVIAAFENDSDKLQNWNEPPAHIQSPVNITPAAQQLYERKAQEAELGRWEKRTLLYRHFLQLSKQVQEQEYYEIIDWYNHEYEILPLWYKQFGHIIKVIMGKRSFRSLFSDNVKKYKD